MPTPGRGASRVVRGLVLAGSCLVLSATAHVAAGGAAPGLEPALLGAAFLSAVCVAIADRRRGLAEIAAVVGVSQPVLHVLLSLAHDGAPVAAAPLPSARMVAAHALAALLVAALLAGVERVWWALSYLSTTLLLRDVRALTTVAGPDVPSAVRPAVRPHRLRRPYDLVLSSAVGRRGPPVAVSA